jgi:threonylcarbamoyladenosine tRNA methylthiotransferase MtaB
MFKSSGLTVVDFSSAADLYVINTCSVTENADRECRTIVNRILRMNPDAFIAVTGCFAQLKPDEIGRMKGVDLVVGANEKFRILDLVKEAEQAGRTLVKACDIDLVEGFVPTFSEGDRTRVFLKVQDGCDYGCTFCTIPMARGKSRSNDIPGVLSQVKELVGEGTNEIVLTGINLGDFGRTEGAGTFSELVEELNTSFSDIRFRISSIEPNLLTDHIIDIVSSEGSFMPHFHIPLQSGSDRILGLMRRRYRTELYRDRVEAIIERMPDCCIGADVIVGFPGETESDFSETLELIESLPLSYLHVFTYSERDNTLAAEMGDVVPIPERKRRNAILRRLSQRKLRGFYEQHEGRTFPVLFEADNKNGLMHGYTPNYIRVNTPYDPELINTVVDCKLSGIGDDGTMKVVPVSEHKIQV